MLEGEIGEVSLGASAHEKRSLSFGLEGLGQSNHPWSIAWLLAVVVFLHGGEAGSWKGVSFAHSVLEFWGGPFVWLQCFLAMPEACHSLLLEGNVQCLASHCRNLLCQVRLRHEQHGMCFQHANA